MQVVGFSSLDSGGVCTPLTSPVQKCVFQHRTILCTPLVTLYLYLSSSRTLLAGTPLIVAEGRDNDEWRSAQEVPNQVRIW